MKIAFLCGSLEPGRDGVGDYTRLLAAELARQGHCCLLVALNDRWFRGGSHSEVGLTDPASYRSPMTSKREIRLAAVLSWSRRMGLVRQALEKFQPEVISLQFVPYAFHNKGLTGGFAGYLSSLLRALPNGGCRTHVMCHELWLGGRSSLPLRQRFIGRVQRTAILNMLRGLGGEAVVHTSNAHYQNRLQRGGIENVRVLPLFGNVPVGNRVGDGWLFSRLNKEGITIDKESRVRHWVGGFFGSLQQDGWAAEPLLGCLSRTADLHRRRLVLLSGGRIGGAGSAEWDRLKSSYAGQIDFLRLGEMEPEQLSQYLNSLDFGLASTRLSVIGKSGTVTAMLEHGIPVLCGSVDLPLAAGTGIENDIRAQELLFRYDQPDFEDRLAMGLPRMESKSRLGEIAARMLEDLNDGQRRPSL